MRWTDRLAAGQRTVVVITLGLVLAALAWYLGGLGSHSGFGWYAYAPLTGHVYNPARIGEPRWLHLLIWLAAIGIWAAGSLLVLRPAEVTAAPAAGSGAQS